MRSFVADAQRDPTLRGAVVEILHGLPARNARLELSTLLDFVRDRVRYQADPLDVEFVQSPARLLDAIRRSGTAAGDCDDMAVLLAALVETAGYPTRFRVQGRPGQDFSHVVIEAQEPAGAWVTLDPTRRSGGLGTAPATRGAREATEMLVSRRRQGTLGQVDWSPLDVPSGFDWGFATPAASVGPSYTPTLALTPTASPGASAVSSLTDTGGGVGDFFSGLFKGISQAAPTIMGVLERTGAYKPITGYSYTGEPIYAGAVAPVGGLYGAGYSYLTQTGPLNISMGTWLLLGGGVLLVVLMKGGKR